MRVFIGGALNIFPGKSRNRYNIYMKRICHWLLIFALLSYCAPFAAAQKRLPSVRLPGKAGAEILPKMFRVPLVKIPVVRMPVGPQISALLATPAVPSFTVQTPLRPVVFPGKKDIDAVIFDLDGTLLDSLWAWENSGVNFLRTQGINPPEGFNDQLAQLSLMDGAKLVKEKYNLPQSPEEILRLTLAPIRERYFHTIMPKPGVPALLHRLKEQGVKMCVATASDKELTVAALKRTGLLPYFDFILTCDEVGAGKRTPVIYEAALKKLGTQKKRTLVAEDALYALTTAHQAGFPTAGIFDMHSAKDQPSVQKLSTYYIPSYTAVQP